MTTIKTTAIASPIDLTPDEATTLGILSDLIAEHMNRYELTARELEKLDEGYDILVRLWNMGGGH